MSTKELRSKTIKGLSTDLDKKLKDLEKVTSDVYKGKEKNINKAKFLRRDIARIKTLIAEKKFIGESEND